MASTYVNDLRLNEMATGDGSGTWGTTTNTNLELIAEAFSYGTEAITTNADTHTTTIADGATDPGRSLYLKYTGTLDSACTITIGPNTVSKVWIIENGTSGSQDIILSQGSGANITIPAGDTKVVYSDGAGAGAAFFDAFASLSVVDLKVQDDLTVTDDMTVGGTLGVTGVLTANAGVVVDNFTLDGTTLALSSGDMTIDAAGVITLDADDAGEVRFLDGGTQYAQIKKDGNNALFQSIVADGDFVIQGIDGASFISALTFDMSAAGAATFNSTVTANSFLQTNSADYQHKFFLANGTTGVGYIYSTGSTFQLDTQAAQPMDLLVNGTSRLNLGTTGSATFTPAAGGHAVFNEGGIDADFRVESDGNTHMLFVDAGNNRVGVGTSTPDSPFDVDSSEESSTALVSTFRAGSDNSNNRANVFIGQDDNSRGLLIRAGREIGDRAITQFILNGSGGTIGSNIVNVLEFYESTSSTDFETTFNQDGENVDFRVESDNNANALFIDGSNGEVMFGKNNFSAAIVGAGIRGTTGESFCSISTGNTLHVYDTSAGTFRFYVHVNGGISNYSANNINLSDEREKKNVEALPSQWDCLKHWDLKQFHYNADDDALPKKYGVIAQEIEAHCPEVIDVFKVDDDTERMGVKEQQMMWMAIKALQEAQTRIETLETRLTALENA
jgi:hypothetical protein